MEDSKNIKINSKNIFIGIVIVLGLLFIGWFFMSDQGTQTNTNLDNDLLPGETNNILVKVNGEDVTSNEVVGIQQSFAQQGQQISSEDALEQAINQELISQEVEKGDYSVSNEEAESAIEQQLATQGATLNDYKQQVESQGISYEEILESTKEQLAIQNYLDIQLEGENFEVSEQEANEFYEEYKAQSPEEIPPFEEIEPQIISMLQQQKQQEAISSLVEELKLSADVEYL
jgi:peptidyl-prolyl cis-trans isomerase SurA